MKTKKLKKGDSTKVKMQLSTGGMVGGVITRVDSPKDTIKGDWEIVTDPLK